MTRLERALYAVSDRVGDAVGTPWCTLAFCGVSVVATPGVFPAWVTAIGQWVAMSFLQLVLLAILQTGQNRSSARLEALVVDTHEKVIEELAEVKAIHSERATA